MSFFIRRAIAVSSDEQRVLRVPVLVWVRMMWDIRARAAGRRESGAFLLGTHRGSVSKARGHVCYDDLDPKSLDTGIVRIGGSGFKKLWRECKARGLCVVADVHSHPRSWVGQSESDRTNPMISEVGHVAFIVPDFARQLCIFFRGVGVYEYLGKHRWRDVKDRGGRERVRLCLW